MKQVCKYCRSEIDSECYVCPVCRKWLHPFRLRKNNPALISFATSFVLILLLFFIPKYFVQKYFLDKYQVREFQSAESHRITIVYHRLVKKKDQVTILGEVKNSGTDSFSSVYIEAAFYDKNNELIEVEKSSVDNFKPGEVRAFKIERCCNKEGMDVKMDDFSSFKLKIVNGYLNQRIDK